ncbi:uncharacterized protein LOC106457402 [Limulus polyphemus]|uniref:Uncharacterized protein LOC106457402 n=1 Tax=Limulus polyphemus TaxID=6850 RepID=A0ABM1S6J7_LIMPO|nr:uncharacterized protein LOC106457402 [Limulus polyphemus]
MVYSVCNESNILPYDEWIKLESVITYSTTYNETYHWECVHGERGILEWKRPSSSAYNNYSSNRAGKSKIPTYSTLSGSRISTPSAVYSRYGQSRDSHSSRDKGSYSGRSRGSSYISDCGNSNNATDYNYGSGFVSDYKPGYTLDYNKSGCISDYGRSNYGKTRYPSDSGKASYFSSGESYSLCGNASDRYLPTASPRFTYGSHCRNTSREETNSGKNTYSKSTSRNDTGGIKSYNTYTRSHSHEYPLSTYTRSNNKAESQPNYSRINSKANLRTNYCRSAINENISDPRQSRRDLNPNLSTINEDVPRTCRKTKQPPLAKSIKSAKVLADPMSDSEVEEKSASDEEEFVHCRATSPSVEAKSSGNHSNIISAPMKMKKSVVGKHASVKMMSVGQQVRAEDLLDSLSRSNNTNCRYTSSATRATPLYFDKYYNKYAMPSYRSCRPSTINTSLDHSLRNLKQEKTDTFSTSSNKLEITPSLTQRNLSNVEKDTPFSSVISAKDKNLQERQDSKEHDRNKNFISSDINVNDDSNYEIQDDNHQQEEKHKCSFDEKDDKNTSRSSSRNNIRSNELTSGKELTARLGSKNKFPRRNESPENLTELRKNESSKRSEILENHLLTTLSSENDSDEPSSRCRTLNTSHSRRRKRKSSRDNILYEGEKDNSRTFRELPPIPTGKESSENLLRSKSYFLDQELSGDTFCSSQYGHYAELKHQSSFNDFNEKVPRELESRSSETKNITNKTGQRGKKDEPEQVSLSRADSSAEESKTRIPVVDSEQNISETNKNIDVPDKDTKNCGCSAKHVSKFRLQVSVGDLPTIQKPSTVTCVNYTEIDTVKQAHSSQKIEKYSKEPFPNENSETEKEQSMERLDSSGENKEDEERSSSPYDNVEAFCFKPVFESYKETSKRDSGFSEIAQCSDSPYDNICTDSSPLFTFHPIEMPEKAHKQQLFQAEKKSKSEDQNSVLTPEDDTKINSNLSKCTKNAYLSKFISECKDIDYLLNDVKGEDPETFEEFENKFKHENMISATSTISQEEHENDEYNNVRSKEKSVSAEAQQNLTLFIGQCQDIDEMLGPLSTFVPYGLASPTEPFSAKWHDQIETPLTQKKTEEDSYDSLEEEKENDLLEEVGPSAVRVHESEAQQPQLDSYTEEIDYSAVRIRENRAMNTEITEYTEEIDSGINTAGQPQLLHGDISKNIKYWLEYQKVLDLLPE